MSVPNTHHISLYQIRDPLVPFKAPRVKTSQYKFPQILPLFGIFKLGHYKFIVKSKSYNKIIESFHMGVKDTRNI